MQIAAGTPLSRRKERWQRHPARIYIFCATENAGGVMRSVSETVPCDFSMAGDDTMGTEALSRHWLRRTLRLCLLNVFSTVLRFDAGPLRKSRGRILKIILVETPILRRHDGASHREPLDH